MRGKPLRILHIEDNDDHADLVAAAASENRVPCHLIRFATAEAGLDYLRLGERRNGPDLILLDLALPGMNGLEFLRLVRREPTTAGIPVVVLSTSERDSDVAEAYQSGANSYISKPTSLEEFIIKLAEMNMYWSGTAELPEVAALP
jgi:CheY-like chemotaxis protein